MSDKRESGDEDNAKTNLIVNYLPQTMTDEHFQVLFAKHGDIRSARIIRNKTTGYSYGFGFVDYFNADDAEQAIESLNGSTLNHKKIKVSYARPSSDEIKNANLYVSNLPTHYNESDVCNLFSSYGEIIQCRLLGSRAGTAFVLFNLHEQARTAMKALNNHLIPGTTFRISTKMATTEPFKKGFFKPDRNNFNGNGKSHPGKGTKGSYSGRNGHHSNSYANEKYSNGQKPSTSGPIRNTTSHNNRYNPLSQHGQFYAQPSEMYPSASQPYVKMNQYYQPPPTSSHFDNSHFNGSDGEHILFVYNIGADANEFTIGQLFADYGSVLRVNVIRRSDNGESRGYGFVTMSSYQGAVKAIHALNGYPYSNNKPLQVSFKKM